MTTEPAPLRYPPPGAMRGDDFVHLVAEMRASQRRWPQHPQQASIEAMALETKVDEAIATGIILYAERPHISLYAERPHISLYAERPRISEIDGPVSSIGAKRRDPDT